MERYPVLRIRRILLKCLYYPNQLEIQCNSSKISNEIFHKKTKQKKPKIHMELQKTHEKVILSRKHKLLKDLTLRPETKKL